MGEQTTLCCCALSFKASVVTASIGKAGRAGTSFLSVRKPAEAFRVKVHVIASNSFDESLTRKITGLEQKRLDYEKHLFDEAGGFLAKSGRACGLRLRLAIQAKRDFSSLTEVVIAGLKVFRSSLHWLTFRNGKEHLEHKRDPLLQL